MERASRAPLRLIPKQTTDEAHVGRRVEIDTQIKHGGDIGGAKKVGALHDNHRSRRDGDALLALSRVGDEIVNRRVNGQPGPQSLQMLDQQDVVAAGHIVEIERLWIEIGEG